MKLRGDIFLKKIATAILTAFFTMGLTYGAMADQANDAVFQLGNDKYKLNDQELNMDTAPIILNNKTYIPVQYLAHALGVADKDISWDKNNQAISLTIYNQRTINLKMKVGDPSLLITDGPGDKGVQAQFISTKTIPMDAAPLAESNEIYLPARPIAEAVGYLVAWDEPSKSILLYPPEMANPAGSNQQLNVSDQDIKSDTATFNVDMELPVLSGLTDGSLQDELNQEIKDKALQTKEKMEKDVQDYVQQAKVSGYPVRPYQLSVRYKSYTNGQVFSLAVQTYAYAGGAHGSTGTDYYNIDTKSGKVLTLKDLFKDNVDYKQIVNQEIKKQIDLSMQQGTGMYFAGDMGFNSISDNQPFYIDANNIIICFSEYEIAPYVAGSPEFKIPVSQLKQDLKDNFLELINQ